MSGTSIVSLRLSPAWPFAERASKPVAPLTDRLNQLVSGVPDVMRPLRLRGLRQVIANANADAQWAKGAVTDLVAQRAILASSLRAQGMTVETAGRALALARELAARLLGTRAYDVQLLGAYAMLCGHLAEMGTGEGKTLTAALAASVAALAGSPVHIVTVNDYLARRDAESLAPFYAEFGLSTGLIVQGMAPEERRISYASDVVYASNKELTFDYLRDQILRRSAPTPQHIYLDRLAGNTSPIGRMVMRGLHFAIVDEADSVLIDEARTPLIISEGGKGEAEGEVAATALSLADQLTNGQDYTIDFTDRRVDLTHAGADKLGVLAVPFGGDWTAAFIREELVCKALSARFLFHRDEHYLVRDGKVQIIDEYTGRIMPDRFWNDGLHQMIETKEGCTPTGSKGTVARITYQRFFTRYRHLCGMSGTLSEAAAELRRVYGLRIARIPPNRPDQRQIQRTKIEPDLTAKWRSIAEQTRLLVAMGRPVLIGTRTVAASLQASEALINAGITHALLNAEQDAKEADIVAEAGQAGRVTVATNMAGRGTDIKLGNNVAARGGLAVILSERHDAARIDRQLAGRCGRQGDPGSVHLILSLQDSLLEPLRRRPFGSMLLRLAVPRHWLALRLFNHMQRRAERTHAAVRRALWRIDTQTLAAIAFSGRPE